MVYEKLMHTVVLVIVVNLHLRVIERTIKGSCAASLGVRGESIVNQDSIKVETNNTTVLSSANC